MIVSPAARSPIMEARNNLRRHHSFVAVRHRRPSSSAFCGLTLLEGWLCRGKLLSMRRGVTPRHPSGALFPARGTLLFYRL